jgi:hypothetical protein
MERSSEGRGEDSKEDQSTGARAAQRQRTTAMTVNFATGHPVSLFAYGAAGPRSAMVPSVYNLRVIWLY